MTLRRKIKAIFLFGFLLFCGFFGVSLFFLTDFPDKLRFEEDTVSSLRLVDRSGRTIARRYMDTWNIDDALFLHQMPPFLKDAFIASEDKRFYAHHGVDFVSKTGAISKWLIGKNRTLRGASSLSEQVVRILNPRPRTLWSKWLEMLDAFRLERRFSKDEIFEFYLNQVPYASHRRGIVQAARFYFGRDLETLSQAEMLALAVLVRAPSRYDLHQKEGQVDIEGAMHRLAKLMLLQGRILERDYASIDYHRLVPTLTDLDVEAAHFSAYVRARLADYTMPHAVIRTTLDGDLQEKVQRLLDARIKALSRHKVKNGAVLVADHQTGDVLAWVSDTDPDTRAIDGVLVPRQPGSLLKPLLYAKALEKGWTAATLIDDSPLSLPAGHAGLHAFKNYSLRHYGPVSLRDALGNSLNIPAVRTVEFVGGETFLSFLHAIGFSSLTEDARFYGDGLALGNGAVSLMELVRAFMMLADGGIYKDFTYTSDIPVFSVTKRVFPFDVTSIITSILSDPSARTLEFSGSGMTFPVETAVKTGTSSNYRDAFAIGYNHRYVVGVWLGNLDFSDMQDLTGAKGAVPLLRSIFSELNKHQVTHPLSLSEDLVRVSVCLDDDCLQTREELFIQGTQPAPAEVRHAAPRLGLLMPIRGMRVAIDPRVPIFLQKMRFFVSGVPAGAVVTWVLNGQQIGQGADDFFEWPVQRGKYDLTVRVDVGGETILNDAADFSVR